MGFARQHKLGNTRPGQCIWRYLYSIKWFSWGALCLAVPYLGLDFKTHKEKSYYLVAILLVGPIFPPKNQVLNMWVHFTQYGQKCSTEIKVVGVPNPCVLRAGFLHFLLFQIISPLFYSIPLCSSHAANTSLAQFPASTLFQLLTAPISSSSRLQPETSLNGS